MALHNVDSPIAGQHMTDWANNINEAVSELQNAFDCEPTLTRVREYLDEKGIEYETGAYSAHKPGGLEPPVLQIEIKEISKKMFQEVVQWEFESIASAQSMRNETIVEEKDDLTYSRVVVRIGE